MLSALSVLFENSTRVMDYTLFTLPRCFEGLNDLCLKLGWYNKIPLFQNLIFALSISLILTLKNNFKVHKHYEKYISLVFSNSEQKE